MFKLILISVLFLVGEINLFPIRQPLLNTQVPLLTQLNNASLTNRWGLSLLELNQSAKPIIKIFDDEYNASVDPAPEKSRSTTDFRDKPDRAGNNDTDLKLYVSNLNDAYFVFDYSQNGGTKVSNDVWIEIESDFSQQYFENNRSVQNKLLTTQTITISSEKLKIYPTKTNASSLVAIKLSDLFENAALSKRVFNFYLRIKKNASDFFEIAKEEMRFFVIVDDIAPQIHVYNQSSFKNSFRKQDLTDKGWWEKGDFTSKSELHNEVKYRPYTPHTFATSETNVVVGLVDLFGDHDPDLVSEGIIDEVTKTNIQLQQQRAPVYFSYSHHTLASNIKPTPFITNDMNETVLQDNDKFHSNDWMLISGIGSHRFIVTEYSGLTRTFYITINQENFTVEVFDQDTNQNLTTFPQSTKGPLTIRFRHYVKTFLYIKQDESNFEMVKESYPFENVSYPLTISGRYEFYVVDELNYYGNGKSIANAFTLSIIQDYTASFFDSDSGIFMSSNAEQNYYGPVILSISHVRPLEIFVDYQEDSLETINQLANEEILVLFTQPGRYAVYIVDDLDVSPTNAAPNQPFEFNIIKDFDILFYLGTQTQPTASFLNPVSEFVKLRLNHVLDTTIQWSINNGVISEFIVSANTQGEYTFTEIGKYKIWARDELGLFATSTPNLQTPFEFEIVAQQNTSSSSNSSDSSTNSSDSESTTSLTSGSGSNNNSSIGSSSNESFWDNEIVKGVIPNAINTIIFIILSVLFDIFIVAKFLANYTPFSVRLFREIVKAIFKKSPKNRQ